MTEKRKAGGLPPPAIVLRHTHGSWCGDRPRAISRPPANAGLQPRRSRRKSLVLDSGLVEGHYLQESICHSACFKHQNAPVAHHRLARSVMPLISCSVSTVRLPAESTCLLRSLHRHTDPGSVGRAHVPGRLTIHDHLHLDRNVDRLHSTWLYRHSDGDVRAERAV